MSTFRDALKQLLAGKIFPAGRAMSGTTDYPLCGEGKVGQDENICIFLCSGQ